MSLSPVCPRTAKCLLLVLLAQLGFHCHSLPAGIVISPSGSYLIAWDGNDGDYFGAAVPDNFALASRGATPFASSEYGTQNNPGSPLDYHLTVNLNDGVYGNFNSWIGWTSESAPDPTPAAGVLFSETIAMTSFAFGRDNMNSNGGVPYNDRYIGTYTIAFTQDMGTSWTDLGTLSYSLEHEDSVVGGGYTGYLRHQFSVSTAGGDPIIANGIRITVSDALIALDEIEVYGAVPEPAASALLMGCCLLGWRILRRRALLGR